MDLDPKQRPGDTYDAGADNRYAPSGGHDKLDTPADQSRAETAAREDAFAAGSAPEPTYGKSASAEELGDSEADAADDTLNNGYTPGKGSKQKIESGKPSWWTKKKVGILGGGIGTGVLGGVMMLTTLSFGPMQLIAASHALQNSFARNDGESSSRLNGLFRYSRFAKTGDIGETRVTALGSKVFGRAIQQLSDAGVEFDRNRQISGRPSSMSIDQEKLSKNYPELKNMDAASAKSFIADKLGVSSDLIKQTSTGKFSIDVSKFSAKSMKLLTNSSLRLINGRIMTAIKARPLKKFFDLPSLFHPFSKARAALEKQYAESIRQKKLQNGEPDAKATAEANAEAATQAENEDFKRSVTEPFAEKAKAASAAIEEEGSGVTGAVSKGLTFTGTACIAYNTAGEIATANRAIVELPAAAAALRVLSAGEQAKSGTGGITVKQIGAMVNAFKDKKGKSIFDGKAFSYLRSPTDKPKGVDLPNKYHQAFSGKSTAKNYKDGAGEIVSDMTGGLVPASVACSAVGQYAQAGISVGLTVASEVATGGADTPVVASLWAAGQQIIKSTVVSMIGITAITDLIKHVAVDSQLPKDVFSGPVGGDLMAFGSRVAAGTAARASGAISLGNDSSTLPDSSGTKYSYDDTEQPVGMFARIFNPRDYNSLVFQLGMAYYGSGWSSGLSGIGSGLLRMGSSLTSGFSSLLPHASATTVQNYDWGMPQYGIPDDMLNDPALADPYANAEQMATVLDSGSGQNYADKASTCFGVNVSKGSDGKWDVTPDHLVDITSDDYVDGGCTENSTTGDVDGATWRRMIMFVYDSSTMKAAACYAGDDASCADLDAGDSSSGGSAETTASTTSTDVPTGDMAALAAQVLKDPNITLGPGAKPDIVAASQNQKVTPGPIAGGGAGTTPCTAGRVPVYVDSTLLKAMLLIARQYKYQIQDVVSDHNCDSGRHPLGRAMDIFQVDGTPLSGHYGDKKVLNFVAGVTSIMSKLMPDGKYPHEAGIGVCSLSNVPNVPSNINYFVDACDEIHVDVGTP